MTYRFLTILTGSNLPKITQPGSPSPPTISKTAIANLHLKAVEPSGARTEKPDDGKK